MNNPLEGALQILELIPSGSNASGESAQEGQTGPSDTLFEGRLTILFITSGQTTEED